MSVLPFCSWLCLICVLLKVTLPQFLNSCFILLPMSVCVWVCVGWGWTWGIEVVTLMYEKCHTKSLIELFIDWLIKVCCSFCDQLINMTNQLKVNCFHVVSKCIMFIFSSSGAWFDVKMGITHRCMIGRCRGKLTSENWEKTPYQLLCSMQGSQSFLEIISQSLSRMFFYEQSSCCDRQGLHSCRNIFLSVAIWFKRCEKILHS